MRFDAGPMWKGSSDRLRGPGAASAALWLPLMAMLMVQTAPARAQSAAEWLLNPGPDAPGEADRGFEPGASPAPTPRRFTKPKASETRPAAAPSRVGRVPTYGVPPAQGAGASGFDSRNRRRVIVRPGVPRPKTAATGPSADPDAAAPRRVSVPVSPSIAGTVPGQPTRRRLKIEDDPFGAVGFYAGSFLVKPAIELYGGYDSNPGRIPARRGSGFYKIAPELVATSDWERHAVGLDLRGSFTGYGHAFPSYGPGASPIPLHLERPDVTGRLTGRLDVTRDMSVNGEARLRVATDNPGSPDIQAGLDRYPLTSGVGATLGLTRRFNRLEMSANALADRATYQESTLTNGVRVSNEDRNYNQFGGTLRASYEIMPGVKPFAEAGLDRREHDLTLDRSGVNRDSRGATIKAGSTFELTRLLTGEAAIGVQRRDYDDATLKSLTGLLVDASLVWSVTPLTSIKLLAKSSINESTLAGVSGVIVREYGAEISHEFRRWLSASAKLSTATSIYDGSTREDRSNVASVGLIYRLTRTAQIKGEFRREWLTSNVPGSDYTANVIMAGLRLQR